MTKPPTKCSQAATTPMFDLWNRCAESDHRLHKIRGRHYSVKNHNPGQRRLSPGEKVCLISPDESAILVWQYQKWGALKDTTYCAIFRNESPVLASTLLLAAEKAIPDHWPRSALTFVNTTAVQGDGKCFKVAGWRKVGRTKKGLLILEKMLQSRNA